MSIKSLSRALGAGLSVALLISACTGDERPFVEAVEAAQSDIGRIEVSPLPGTVTPVSVAVGGQLQLDVTSFTTAGVPTNLSPEDRNWSVSDTNIATIDRDGVLTGLADGEVDVNFIFGSLQASSLSVVVSSAPLDGLSAIQGDTDLEACLGFDYAAVGSFGELQRVLTDNVEWTLDAPNVGELLEQDGNPGGITLVPNESGPRAITASSGGFSDTLDLVVADTLTALSFPAGARTVEEGDSISLTVSGSYNREGVAVFESVTDFVRWQVTDGTGSATISNEDFARGVLTATEQGQVTVSAMCGDFSAIGQVVLIGSDDDDDDNDELSFEQDSPATIALTSSGLQLAVSTGSSFDEDDDVSDDVNWLSLNPAIATVNTTGFVQPLAIGTVQIQVTLDGVTETITINVI